MLTFFKNPLKCFQTGLTKIVIVRNIIAKFRDEFTLNEFKEVLYHPFS